MTATATGATAPPTVSVTGLTFSPTSVISGKQDLVTVTLSGVAGNGVELDTALIIAKFLRFSNGASDPNPWGYDFVGASDWAHAGFDGWPTSVATPSSSLESMGANPKASIPAFDVVWGGFGSNWWDIYLLSVDGSLSLDGDGRKDGRDGYWGSWF